MQDMLDMSTGKIRNSGFRDNHELLPYGDRPSFSSTKNIASILRKVNLPTLSTLDSKKTLALLHNDQLQHESKDFSSIKRMS